MILYIYIYMYHVYIYIYTHMIHVCIYIYMYTISMTKRQDASQPLQQIMVYVISFKSANYTSNESPRVTTRYQIRVQSPLVVRVHFWEYHQT